MAIRRVLAPNPGPYTGPGTNTYIVDDGERAVVIDPGPVIDAHRLAIVESIGELTPAAMIVTHNHPDHAPLANPLAAELDIPSYGFAPGPDFSPDVMLVDGATLDVGATRMTAIHTPGHTWDHLCFLVDDVLFTGDHIMGGSTVIIEDAAAYFDSLYRVASLGASLLLPGHGDEIEDAAAAVQAYIAHRKERENQIVAAVLAGSTTARAITESVYAGIDPALIPAATSQVEVQLRKLVSENRLILVPGDAGERFAPPPEEF